MSLKQEIETWVKALGHYDGNEFDEALKEFDGISDTSKILFNCGVIHATLGEHEKAVECYQRAVRLDQYLAVAYFQQGVSNFLVGDFEEALANFNDTLLYLRGNNMIDYAQLGLMFKLYSCEVLFNRGLCYIYLQQKEAGMQDFSFAVKEKVVEDHNVIDEAIKEEAEGYTVFSIPVGVVYRPNQAKVKNLKTKDYLGKARLVAASDRANAFTGFAGSEIKNAGKADVKDDRPTENISYAASNLVKPGLQSKRQQSEPPVSRNVFPPTPPPESEKGSTTSSSSGMSRGASVRNGPKPMPAKLNIEKARPNERYEIRDDGRSPQGQQKERLGTTRTASEPRGPPARQMSSRQRPQRRQSEEDEDGYPEELYDMYSSSRNSRNPPRKQPKYIEEEDEDASDYDDGSFDENDFEMVSSRPPPRRAPSSVGGGSGRGASRRPDIRKIRVKVHSEDVRYIMIGAAVEFPDLVDRIRDKFGLRKRFKIKVRDDDQPDGDMITLGDQDDLDMIIMSVKSNAKKERQDMGKMELWVQEV
ncbi:CAD & PB1 [Glarea lozoyensis ATCC 20868]|uniref:CAD & PB1 n=1 Tax=Glarea lozoyensis (strain ATCC 20868 / MF5171) TaxID=1116229 RepID=S3D602_GLAL2|nr:CAD & PB1 [Glarea lozoyensis ATCC 20868]EPE33882.1 CAD & PB1 [Glarea lozoyensis ATCC 20868]